MRKLQLYKIAISTRQFEIQLFWQRSNYFLALNSAAAIGFFTLPLEKPRVPQLLFCVFGLIVSALWFAVNLGSKYWQLRWEAAAERMEREYAPDAKLFDASRPEVDEEVKKALKRSAHRGPAAWLDHLILWKPSVSMAMTILSLAFFFIWAALLSAMLCRYGEDGGPNKLRGQEASHSTPLRPLDSTRDAAAY